MAFCAVGGVNLHPGDMPPEYAPKRRIFSAGEHGNEKRPQGGAGYSVSPNIFSQMIFDSS